jgi:hypothetical protein
MGRAGSILARGHDQPTKERNVGEERRGRVDDREDTENDHNAGKGPVIQAEVVEPLYLNGGGWPEEKQRNKQHLQIGRVDSRRAFRTVVDWAAWHDAH